MQANGIPGPIHGGRIGSKLPPLPPRPAVPAEPALPSDGVVLSRPQPATEAVAVAPQPAAPVVAAPVAQAPAAAPPAVLVMQDAQQFFLGGSPAPAQPTQETHAPKTIAEMRAESDREVSAIMADIAKGTRETTQKWIDASRNASSASPAAAAPPPPAPLSSSQKSQLQQLQKKGLSADFARRLVQENDQFKIRLFLR